MRRAAWPMQVEDLQKGLQSVRTEHSAAISLHSQLKESNDKLTRQCGDLKSALACTTADVTAHETKACALLFTTEQIISGHQSTTISI